MQLRPECRAPNFVFGLAPNSGLTLRKLSGRSVILIFCRSTSELCKDAIGDLQASRRGPVVLAINDGESAEALAANKLTPTLVTDPGSHDLDCLWSKIWPMHCADPRIGRRYGSPLWPHAQGIRPQLQWANQLGLRNDNAKDP